MSYINKKKVLVCFFAILLFSSIDITVSSEQVNKLYNNPLDLDDILSLIEQVNESLISPYLEQLVSFGPRLTGTEECQQSAEYIYNKFKELGLNVSYHPWKSVQYSSQNIVATLTGRNTLHDAIIILCAHYDTTETSPGANDDGSGIATLLTVANILSEYSFNHTIRFVAFSGEEEGTYGSHFYARDCYKTDDNIIAVLNIDTVGYTTDVGGRSVYLLKTERSQWISSKIQNICQEYQQYLNIKINPIANRRNDHQSFLEYGFDAVQFVQLERGDYPLHTPNDTLDKINYSYLSKVIKLILILTLNLANKEYDVRVQFISPKEGYLYIYNNPSFHLPGYNIRGTGLRGMTYLVGDTIAQVNIFTNERINSVVFCLDGHSAFSGFLEEPPYEWTIEKPFWTIFPLFGKHILSVYVTTESGAKVYDEMDIFFV